MWIDSFPDGNNSEHFDKTPGKLDCNNSTPFITYPDKPVCLWAKKEEQTISDSTSAVVGPLFFACL